MLMLNVLQPDISVDFHKYTNNLLAKQFILSFRNSSNKLQSSRKWKSSRNLVELRLKNTSLCGVGGGLTW